MAFLKYGAISVSIFLIALGIRYIPYIEPVRDFLPLSPEAFDRLGVYDPPTKNFDDSAINGIPLVISRDSVFGSFDSPSSDEEQGSNLQPTSIPNRFFERFDSIGSYESPAKEFEITHNGEVKPLPIPKSVVAPIVPPYGYVGLPTPTQIVQVVERIVERVIIREVEKPVPVPVPVPQTIPAPPVKPAPSPADSSDAFAAACSIHTFENSASGSSHTLIYRCEGFNQCSIAKNGETFVDVNGKGYFNFSGTPPSNYKMLCDDKARVWSSSITPFTTKPLFTQLAFRWFQNDDVEVGAEAAAEINQPVSYKAINRNGQIRLRLVVLAERAQVPKGEAKFKLQAALVKPTVPISSALSNYGSLCNQIPDSQFKDMQVFENLAFFNNPSLEDKTLLAPSIEDPFYGFAIPQTYQESNSISNSNASIPLNTAATWDISFRLREISSNELICLRLVRQDNVLLDGYENWPAIYNY